MGPTRIAMSLLPYTSPYAGYGYGYGAPYGAYGGYGPGFYGAGYPYGPYGMTAEEIQKVREAEEKAFNEAEAKRKEFMEAEKKKYEEFVAAEKKKYRTTCPPKRLLSRMPSPRIRSWLRSLAHTHMAHTAQQGHTAAVDMDMATDTPMPMAMATVTPMATVVAIIRSVGCFTSQ